MRPDGARHVARGRLHPGDHHAAGGQRPQRAAAAHGRRRRHGALAEREAQRAQLHRGGESLDCRYIMFTKKEIYT